MSNTSEDSSVIVIAHNIISAEDQASPHRDIKQDAREQQEKRGRSRTRSRSVIVPYTTGFTPHRDDQHRACYNTKDSFMTNADPTTNIHTTPQADKHKRGNATKDGVRRSDTAKAVSTGKGEIRAVTVEGSIQDDHIEDDQPPCKLCRPGFPKAQQLELTREPSKKPHKNNDDKESFMKGADSTTNQGVTYGTMRDSIQAPESASQVFTAVAPFIKNSLSPESDPSFVHQDRKNRFPAAEQERK